MFYPFKTLTDFDLGKETNNHIQLKNSNLFTRVDKKETFERVTFNQLFV